MRSCGIFVSQSSFNRCPETSWLQLIKRLQLAKSLILQFLEIMGLKKDRIIFSKRNADN